MTFNRVIFLTFKANIRKYLLYFLCNSFTIMILFTYATLLTNKNFMSSNNIDPFISSNLIAPSIIIVIFSFFFIMYTQSSFIKFRKKEFGLFMVLGMTKKDVRKIMLFENCMVAFISLITGLLIGTIFSIAFFYIVMIIVDINGITLSISFESYIYTAVFYIIIYLLVISYNLVISLKYDIVDLLKSLRKDDRNLISGALAGLFGIMAIGIAFYDMMCNTKIGDSSVLLRSVLLCLIGMYLITSNFIWFLRKIVKSSTKKYYKNMLYISNLKYTFGQTKKVLFVISLLVGLTIFFGSLSLIMTADSTDSAIKHNPFDIAYLEFYGKNNISEEALNSVVKSDAASLVSHKTLEFVYNQSMIILSDKNLNSVLGTSLDVKKGNFLNLFLIVEKDGYPHDVTEIKEYNIKTNNGGSLYTSQGSIKEMLFNNVPLLNNKRYLIFNEDDYIKMEEGARLKDKGKIDLLSFTDWRKTGPIVTKLDDELRNYNLNNTAHFYENAKQDIEAFKLVSKIEEYERNRQSYSFLTFLLVFIGILFYVSSGVILHFKLSTEIERERVKYKKLYKIGITKNELSKTISKELRVLFFLPFILGMIFASFYICSLVFKSMNTNFAAAIGFPIALGIAYLGLQVLYYLIYRRIYIKSIIYGL